jgi:Ni/Fe-hydrogenase subunit HybB-like protein
LSGDGSYEALMFWLETALLAVPALLVVLPRVRRNPQALFSTAVLVVGGFLVNRLNVSTTGLHATSGFRYLPSWGEAAVTMSIVVLGLMVFRLAVRWLPVFENAAVAKEVASEPAYAER